MVKHRIVCACGHSVEVSTHEDLVRGRLLMSRVVGLCPDCCKSNRQSMRAVGIDSVHDVELVQLLGSDYQLAWARGIRLRHIREFQNSIAKYPHSAQRTLMHIMTALVNKRTKAGWWIDNERDTFGALVRTCPDELHAAMLEIVLFHARAQSRSTQRICRVGP